MVGFVVADREATRTVVIEPKGGAHGQPLPVDILVGPGGSVPQRRLATFGHNQQVAVLRQTWFISTSIGQTDGLWVDPRLNHEPVS